MKDIDLKEKAKVDKEQAWQDLFENLEEVHALNPDVSEREVHADVAAAIRSIRHMHNVRFQKNNSRLDKLTSQSGSDASPLYPHAENVE